MVRVEVNSPLPPVVEILGNRSTGPLSPQPCLVIRRTFLPSDRQARKLLGRSPCSPEPHDRASSRAARVRPPENVHRAWDSNPP